jgi:hypothetical protein
MPSIWAAPQIRVATYNASLALNTKGELAAVLRPGTYSRAKQVAEMIQIIQPDVLLLNEFDFDVNGTAMTRLNDKYFKVSQNGRPPQDFPYRYTAPSNTGTHSGFDFDNNGVVDDTPGDQGYGGDAFGFGEFEGKYGMAVFSKYPIDLLRRCCGEIYREICCQLRGMTRMSEGFFVSRRRAIGMCPSMSMDGGFIF